jgi:hypothetical protein
MNLEYQDIDGIRLGLYKDGPVGISVSCGADSAIILYWLMKNVEHDLHIYNLIADYRRDVLEPPFDRVVTKCAELTGKTNYYVHKFYVPKPPPELMFKIWRDSLDSGQVDIVYTGLTKFPPDEVYEEWEDKLPEWHVRTRKHDRVQSEFGYEIVLPEGTNFSNPPLSIDGNPVDRISIDGRAYSPLVNHDKRSVAKLYKVLGVENELFPVTRSCEDDNHLQGHCGKCWWCGERNWAFGYLE